MAFKFEDRYDKEKYQNVLIVDALNLSFRWKHGAKYKDFKYDLERTISSIANSYKCGQILICADWGKSAYRKAIFPDYKADRAERYKDQTEAEAQAFKDFFKEYEAALVLMEENWEVFRYKGVEADDIAAFLVKYKNYFDFDKIWLLSSDGDWDLLISEDVSRFSWRNRKEIRADNWYEHYEVSPEEFISFKCLMGDKSDNIPGIPSVGPKRAASVIEQYGSAFDVYDAIPLDGEYKYIQNINENAEQILTNYRLMDLMTYCDEAIGEDNIKDIRGRYDVTW
jgi:DNA polymerase-1